MTAAEETSGGLREEHEQSHAQEDQAADVIDRVQGVVNGIVEGTIRGKTLHDAEVECTNVDGSVHNQSEVSSAASIEHRKGDNGHSEDATLELCRAQNTPRYSTIPLLMNGKDFCDCLSPVLSSESCWSDFCGVSSPLDCDRCCHLCTGNCTKRGRNNTRAAYNCDGTLNRRFLRPKERAEEIDIEGLSASMQDLIQTIEGIKEQDDPEVTPPLPGH